jgi:hypothetical protein
LGKKADVSAGVSVGTHLSAGEKERERTVLGGKRDGPWAGFGYGLNSAPGPFYVFFGQNLFPFSVLFETFCKNTPILFKPILKICEFFFLVIITITRKGLIK